MAPPSPLYHIGCEVPKCAWKSSGINWSATFAVDISPSISAGARPASAMAFSTATSAISFAVRPEGPLYSDSPTPTIATSPRTSGIS